MKTKILGIAMLTILLVMAALTNAQTIRSFGQIYSDNLRGGHTMFGNTIMAREEDAMNNFSTISYSNGKTSQYGNDNSNMQFVDVDAAGSGTFNSSSADLILPAGSNSIKYARLYWGGRIDDDDTRYATRRNVKIRKGTSGAYTSITAPLTQIDQTLVEGDDYYYQAYIDVTAFINTNAAGTYTIADVAASTGSVDEGGNFAGWTIVVVYQNNSLPFSSVRLYDGYLQVYDDGEPVTRTITLNGLNAPGNSLTAAEAYMTSMVWEGDANLGSSEDNPTGDYIKVNGTSVSNAVNPVNNVWNGTISKNGTHITSKYPNFKNQMSIDIDEIQVGVGYNILPNATSVNVKFGTEADQYFPSVFAFTMRMKDPTIVLDKFVTDNLPPYNILNANEILTYTLVGSNTGAGASVNTFVVDTLPAGVTFVPGSLMINGSPGGFTGFQSDDGDGDRAYKGINGSKHYVKFFLGSGATGFAGGSLLQNENYSVSFQVQTLPDASILTTISNTGRIISQSHSGDNYVDDGTAIIGPAGSPLNVKMGTFTVKKEGNNAILRWTTLGEVKNDRFEIERSEDGIHFNKAGVTGGQGTTGEAVNYMYNDAISNTSATVLYYRLRIVDTDGKASYTKIVSLRLDNSKAPNNFTVYPNPFTSDVKLNMHSEKESNVTIRISNIAGQQIVNRLVMLQPGENTVVVKDLDALKPGIHLMEIITTEGKLTQKIMKK